MKRPYAFGVAILGLAAAYALLSCASSPKMDPNALPEIQVRLAPERDLAHRGVSFTVDPLVPPLRLFEKSDEFVSFAIEIRSPKPIHVAFDGDVKSENGELVARLYTADELRDYWKARTTRGDKNLNGRLEVINRYYAPSLSFDVRSGNHEYYLVCVGKNPLPRPAEAELFVSIGDEAPQSFFFPLEPVTKK
jgi:hypothetical protein